jgi:hypothetical protein
MPTEVQSPLTISPKDQTASLVLVEDKASAGEKKQATSDRHAKFSEDVHDYLREYIRNADQKATFFFAAFTALLAFLNTQNVTARWLKDVRLWSLVDGLGFLSMSGLALGAAILLSVVLPRFKGSRRGLIFFRAIAEYESSAEYAADVLTYTGDEIVRRKLLHCHDLSNICTAKYRTLIVGFWVGAVGVVTALLFLLLAKSGSA